MALFLHKPQICSHLARREEPAAVTVAASVAAGVQESCSVSASWRTHRRMQARSAHHGIVASAHAGSIDACRQGLLGACIAGFCPGGARRRLMQGTAQRSNTDTTQRGPTCQVERTTQSSMAPLVRVNGQAFDPTATSVVPSYEGFWQGSGEN